MRWSNTCFAIFASATYISHEVGVTLTMTFPYWPWIANFSLKVQLLCERRTDGSWVMYCGIHGNRHCRPRWSKPSLGNGLTMIGRFSVLARLQLRYNSQTVSSSQDPTRIAEIIGNSIQYRIGVYRIYSNEKQRTESANSAPQRQAHSPYNGAARCQRDRGRCG